MNKILMLSHGDLSKQMFSTAQLIYGELVNTQYITLEPESDLEIYRERINKIIDETDGGLLILVDLFGGTPFITAHVAKSKYEGRKEIEIVTGMNLPMILEILNSLSLPLKSLSKLACDAGKMGITNKGIEK